MTENLNTPQISEEELATLKQQDKDGYTTLHLAIINKEDLGVVQALLNKLTAEQLQELLVIKDSKENTPLHLAVVNQNLGIINAFVEKLESHQIYELLATRRPINNNANAMHMAARTANCDIINALLKKLDAQQISKLLAMKDDRMSYIPMQYGGRPDVINALMKKLTAQQIKDLLAITQPVKNNGTIIICAALEGNPDTIGSFLQPLDADQIKELLAIPDMHGNTPLHFAILKDNPDNIKAFLNKLNPKQIKELLAIKNKTGRTPLHWTGQNKNPNTFHALLHSLHHSKIKELLAIEDNESNTPLKVATPKNKTILDKLCDSNPGIEDTSPEPQKSDGSQIKNTPSAPDSAKEKALGFLKGSNRTEWEQSTFVKEVLENLPTNKKTNAENHMYQLIIRQALTDDITTVFSKRTKKQFAKAVAISAFKGFVGVLFLGIPFFIKLAKAIQLKKEYALFEKYFPKLTAPVNGNPGAAGVPHTIQPSPGVFHCFRAVYEKEGIFTEKPLVPALNTFPKKNKK